MKSLKLNKATVASLNSAELSKVNGGICIASTKRGCKIRVGGSLITRANCMTSEEEMFDRGE
jgi:hypothetical protein